MFLVIKWLVFRFPTVIDEWPLTVDEINCSFFLVFVNCQNFKICAFSRSIFNRATYDKKIGYAERSIFFCMKEQKYAQKIWVYIALVFFWGENAEWCNEKCRILQFSRKLNNNNGAARYLNGGRLCTIWMVYSYHHLNSRQFDCYSEARQQAVIQTTIWKAESTMCTIQNVL